MNPHTWFLAHLHSALTLTALAIFLVAAVYGVILALTAWWAARESPRTEFFTCDKHGAFPMKWTIEAPMPEGDVHRCCPFCFNEAYKKAETFVRSKEHAT